MKEFEMQGDEPGTFYRKDDADAIIESIKESWKSDLKTMEMQRRRLQQVVADNTRIRELMASMLQENERLKDRLERFKASEIKLKWHDGRVFLDGEEVTGSGVMILRKC